MTSYVSQPPSDPPIRREVNHELPDNRIQLIDAISNLNEELSLKLIKEYLNEGEDPVLLVQDCQIGMQRVGEKYENKQYFLSGLIMGGEIFSQAVQLIRPSIVNSVSGNESGIVLIGTVCRRYS